MLKNWKKDELVRGSLILFIMIGFFNFLNYLFHFFMARMLGPVDYGVLAVLMSILYIFSIPSEAIQTVVSKYTSKFNVRKQYGKMKDLLYRSMKKSLLYSSLLFLIFLPIAFLLSAFLKIGYSLMILSGLFIFYAFITPILRGLLQGRRKFKELGFNMVLESVIKVFIAVVLVIIGFQVYGAIGGVLIGGFTAVFLVFAVIKEIMHSKRRSSNFKGIYSYSFYILIAITSIVLMYSIDIIIARRFFSPEIAGKYAVVSMLGKMIFFGTQAIGKAMFPLASESHENGKDTRKIFSKAVKIVSIICLAALLIYFLFPKLIIEILFGSAYTDVSNILFIIGLAFSFLSLSNIFILYKLSKNETRKFPFILLVFAITQIIVLSILNSTLLQFSIALLTVNFLMFVYSLSLLKWKSQ